MAKIKVTFLDEVFLRVESDESVERHLKKNFQISVNTKPKQSDESIKCKKTYHLYCPQSKRMYAGLLPHLMQFAKEFGHSIGGYDGLPVRISEEDFREIVGAANTQELLKERERKATILLRALRRKRATMLFQKEDKQYPIIHYILYWFLTTGEKCLLIVWSTSLADWLHREFAEMSDHIYLGHKEDEKPILIANWESIYKKPKEWFDQFDAVIVDEIERYYPESLIPMMESMRKTKNRIGIVKSSENLKISHRMFFEGLFGAIEEASDPRRNWQFRYGLKVFCLRLEYVNEEKEMLRRKERAEEINFIQRHEKRNRFICNLACKSKGNVLLISVNSDHGKLLHRLIRKKLKKEGMKKKLFLSVGASNQKDEEMLSYIQKEDGWIIVSSYRKIGSGFPIHSLDHTILAAPYKNEITNLKSIGSGLEDRNDICKLYDIIDDFGLEGWKNHLVRDAEKRMRRYKIEEEYGRGSEYGLFHKNTRIEIE